MINDKDTFEFKLLDFTTEKKFEESFKKLTEDLEGVKEPTLRQMKEFSFARALKLSNLATTTVVLLLAGVKMDSHFDLYRYIASLVMTEGDLVEFVSGLIACHILDNNDPAEAEQILKELRQARERI